VSEADVSYSKKVDGGFLFSRGDMLCSMTLFMSLKENMGKVIASGDE